ncbi:hypothetical protein GGR56DRAFT_439692 [Xylariaceae sp. FL0804]|nr:hypothetical protein GGR56DRAFT_439692 [Xylariaceae sp. FL0804]
MLRHLRRSLLTSHPPLLSSSPMRAPANLRPSSPRKWRQDASPQEKEGDGKAKESQQQRQPAPHRTASHRIIRDAGLAGLAGSSSWLAGCWPPTYRPPRRALPSGLLRRREEGEKGLLPGHFLSHLHLSALPSRRRRPPAPARPSAGYPLSPSLSPSAPSRALLWREKTSKGSKQGGLRRGLVYTTVPPYLSTLPTYLTYLSMVRGRARG